LFSPSFPSAVLGIALSVLFFDWLINLKIITSTLDLHSLNHINISPPSEWQRLGDMFTLISLSVLISCTPHLWSHLLLYSLISWDCYWLHISILTPYFHS
jgi:hypothetical protein